MNNPIYFYELFLRTRYRYDFTVGDLKSLAEFVMLSDLDFKKIKFDKSVQKKVLSRFLTVTEERIDRVILHSEKFSFMALSFIELELNPYEQVDESRKWPFLSRGQKALLLKYLVELKNNTNNTNYLSQMLEHDLDMEMIPARFINSCVEDIQKFIKTYDPQYVPSLQLSIEV